MGGNGCHRWRCLDELEQVGDDAVLGLSENAFRRRIAGVQADLVRARTNALQRDRPPPAYRDLRLVARGWGWLELRVYPPIEPEPYEIVGIGVAEPGRRPTVEMADSHHRRAWSEPATGIAGGAIVGYVAPAGFWAAPALLAVGIAACGMWPPDSHSTTPPMCSPRPPASPTASMRPSARPGSSETAPGCTTTRHHQAPRRGPRRSGPPRATCGSSGKPWTTTPIRRRPPATSEPAERLPAMTASAEPGGGSDRRRLASSLAGVLPPPRAGTAGGARRRAGGRGGYLLAHRGR